MKKILLPIGIIIIILILVVAFLGSGSSKSTTNNNEPKKVGEASLETTDSKQQAVQTQFKLLDRIDFENRILTVNSIKRNFIESGSYAMKPKEGLEFILVNVTIENNSDKTISFNTFDFQIENSSGVRTTYAYVGTVPDQLNSGDLAVGGKLTANIPFEVKKGETGLKLVFKPSLWTEREAVVSLD